MKIKCENVIICGNYRCAWNCDCRCGHDVVALDANGKCSLEKPRNRAVEKARGIAEAQNGGGEFPVNSNAC